jgi:phosphatidylglycerol:prolipoprotein diacylglycerol transferase
VEGYGLSRPTTFYLGGIPVHLFGLALALGIALALLLVKLECRRRQFPYAPVLDLLSWSILAGIAGARLVYVGMNAGHYLQAPQEIVMVWRGGLSFAGGVLGGAAAAFLGGKGLGRPLSDLADLVAPGLAAGYAVARLGCDVYGKITNLPWAIPVYGDLRHPVQYYSALGAALIFVMLWQRRQQLTGGRLFALYLVLYALSRSAIELFRDGPMLGPLTLTQMVMVPVALAGLVVLKWGRRMAAG